MDKVYQVFVSSTYADLADERRRVSETLAKAGYIPAGMELFPATDQQQLEFIKRVIDRCDYYVVIVGGRYGSLADENISFTEKEYEYALERRIPVLGFLHKNPEAIAVGKTDQDSTKAQKLRAFRDRLATGRMVDYWVEANELCTKVVIAVGQTTNLTPGVGWIRGDQAIDPKVVQEMERLRIENTELKSRLAELEGGEITFPEHLAGPEDQIDLTISRNTTSLPQTSLPDLIAKVTVGDLFKANFEFLLSEQNEYYARDNILRTVLNLAGIDVMKNTAYKLDMNVVRQLGYHFESLGLIRLSAQTAPSGARRVHWIPTEKARRFVLPGKAISKTCP